MTAFIVLKRDEGLVQRREWVNVDAIDSFSHLSNDGRTLLRLRSGSSLYVAESETDILAMFDRLGVESPT